MGQDVIHRAWLTSTHPIAKPAANHPSRWLQGHLQVDGYAGYRKLAERGDVRLAFCWVHVRRRFYKLAISGPAPIASEALERIAGLYAIEKDIRGRSPEERRPVRRKKPTADRRTGAVAAHKTRSVGQKGKLAKPSDALSRWEA